MITNTILKARISKDVKKRALIALEKMGVNTSDVICMVLIHVADEGKLPFEVKTPNTTTENPILELDAGKAKPFDSASSLLTI